jgi:hypothetical protein
LGIYIASKLCSAQHSGYVRGHVERAEMEGGRGSVSSAARDLGWQRGECGVGAAGALLERISGLGELQQMRCGTF